MEKKQLQLKNCMEDIVTLLAEEVIQKKDICKCEQCLLDISAIALNKLPPKYIVTRKGEVYAKTDLLSRQFRTDVIIQLLHAIEIVSNNPHHNSNKGL
ncbi:MAG TPA: late competence development ComFB family protein [Thermoanaerobacterales bacterium]|jgi:competence protein ComFB|nr:late competence development ComFB family protein [Thermoanaerobacterales bacterium]